MAIQLERIYSTELRREAILSFFSGFRDVHTCRPSSGLIVIVKSQQSTQIALTPDENDHSNPLRWFFSKRDGSMYLRTCSLQWGSTLKEGLESPTFRNVPSIKG